MVSRSFEYNVIAHARSRPLVLPAAALYNLDERKYADPMP